jgi:dTDP-4-dehydrorhamnose reductase
MKYLISGRNGQLARAFIQAFERKSIDFIAPDKATLDITKPADVAEMVSIYKPNVILNCAAYNLVDQAERDNERAYAVNSEGPKNLAVAASRHKAVLVHFGSDYVFDGNKESGLYNEEDEVNPLSQYGKSKLSGEEEVFKHCPECLIFRSSWIYGEGKQNFIYKLREWADAQEFLRVASDEFSVPTCASVLVDMTLRSLEAGLTGLWNVTNGGYCSRYEWATAIAKSLGIKKFIRPVSMDVFHLPARRPKFSAMANISISSQLNVSIPFWKESVESFLREME